MKEMTTPHYVEFPKIGNPSLGYISVAEISENVPFEIERVYWTYHTPHSVQRGGHAHKSLQQIIIAVNGTISFNVEDQFGKMYAFELNQPNTGIFLPPLTWRDIKFSHDAVLLCLASQKYSEEDYIRDYTLFKEFQIDE